MKFKILKDKIFEIFVIFFTVFPFVLLFFIIGGIFKKGISSINLKFLTSLPKPPGEQGGGILNSITGTIILVLLSSIITIPLGIFIGIFLYEFKNSKFGRICSFLVNIFYGIPSIVIGIIAYIWIVKQMGHFSALSGAIALSLIFLPVVIKSTEETLKMLPFYLIEGSLALGISYPKTVFKVLLPCALSGITSGILTGIARISGETAPLLFTAFGNPFLNFNILKPISSLPHIIFTYTISPYDDWHKQAYGASLILIFIVFIFTFLGKYFTKKWKI